MISVQELQHNQLQRLLWCSAELHLLWCFLQVCSECPVSLVVDAAVTALSAHRCKLERLHLCVLPSEYWPLTTCWSWQQ